MRGKTAPVLHQLLVFFIKVWEPRVWTRVTLVFFLPVKFLRFNFSENFSTHPGVLFQTSVEQKMWTSRRFMLWMITDYAALYKKLKGKKIKKSFLNCKNLSHLHNFKYNTYAVVVILTYCFRTKMFIVNRSCRLSIYYRRHFPQMIKR